MPTGRRRRSCARPCLSRSSWSGDQESGREALRQRRVACLGAPELGEVVEDPADDRKIKEKREGPHLAAAVRTAQAIDFLDASDHLRPEAC